jgi:hypothetical protein
MAFVYFPSPADDLHESAAVLRIVFDYLILSFLSGGAGLFGVNGLSIFGGVITLLNSSECIMENDAVPPFQVFLPSKQMSIGSGSRQINQWNRNYKARCTTNVHGVGIF